MKKKKKKGALRRGDKVWRRAGEELITCRQAGEQQTDATRARLSSALRGWRETEEKQGAEEEKEWCKGGGEKRGLLQQRTGTGKEGGRGVQ